MNGPLWARGLRRSAVVIALVLAFALGLMAALDQPHASYYLTLALSSLPFSVPLLLVASSVQDHGRMLRLLQPAAVVLLVAGAVRLGVGVGGTPSYSQSDGYLALPAAVVFVDAFVQRPRARAAVLAAGALGLLLASGARGPLLAFVAYVVARGLLALRRRPGALVVLLAIGIAVTQAFDPALRAFSGPLSRALTSHGLSSRSLDRLVEGNFLQDRARGSLARLSWDLTMQHPLTGVGVARDRLLLATEMGKTDPVIAQGWYPHNIVLELLLQYGFFGGGALVLLLAVTLCRALLDDGDPERARLVLVFAGLGLFPLFVSGSYLTWPPFFAMVGCCLTPRRRDDGAPGLVAVRTPVASQVA